MRLFWGFALAAVLALAPATIASAQIQLHIGLAYVNSNDGAGHSTTLPNVTVPGDNVSLSQVNLTSGQYVNHVFNVYATVTGLAADQDVTTLVFGGNLFGGVTGGTYTPNTYSVDPPSMGSPASDAPATTWYDGNQFNVAGTVTGYAVRLATGTSTGGSQGNTYGDYAAFVQLGESAPFLLGQQVLTCNSSGSYSFVFRPNPGYLEVINGNTGGAAANVTAESYPTYSGFGDSALFAPRASTDLTWANGATSTWAVADGTLHWTQTASPSTTDNFYHQDTVRFTSNSPANRTVTLAGNLNPASVVVNSSDDYVFTGSGSIIGAGTTLVKAGAGKLTVSNTGTNTYTGLTTVQGGTLQLSGTAAQNPVLNLGGADLQAGQLVFDYSPSGTIDPVTTIRTNLHASTIYSSTAPAGVGIGYVDNGTSTVTLKPVLVGDVNMDGTVDISDLSLLAGSWLGANKYWADGDVNYDGSVDISDLSLLAANWLRSYTSPSPLPGMSFSDGLKSVGLGGVTPVPEPGTLALLLLAALGVGARVWVRKQRG